MTRTLVIEGSGELWGSERALLDLLDVLPRTDLAICCPAQMPLNDELNRRRLLVLPYYVYGLHLKSRWHRLQAALGVLRACIEFRPDVIYLNQGGAYKVTLPAAMILDLPLVAHIRIFEDASYLAKQTPNPRRLRKIIAISGAIETEVRRFPQLDSIQLQQIYDGYTPTALPFQDVSTQERALNRLACIGRLVPVKGQDVLVRALCLLKELGKPWECLFVGDGEEGFVQNLQDIASRGNAANSIRWLGFVNDVIPLLQTCSFLVCPSHREPLGRVIFEAWDAGAVPVVFSGSGGAAEIVSAAQGGILYKQQTPISLAEAIRQAVMLDHEQRTCFVNNGRAWMAENCDPESYGRRLSTILAAAEGTRETHEDPYRM